MEAVVPDVNIEDLPIPYCAVATDLCTGEEVVFRTGKLFDAIRASISIPSLFRPVKHGMSLLIDGCMVNCLPLNHVARKEGDILVAFDTNYMDINQIRAEMVREQVEQAAEDAFYELSREQAGEIIADFKQNQTDGIFTRLRTADGIPLTWMKSRFSQRLNSYMLNAAKKHIEYGNIKKTDETLSLTEKGIFISDAVIREFIYID